MAVKNNKMFSFFFKMFVENQSQVASKLNSAMKRVPRRLLIATYINFSLLPLTECCHKCGYRQGHKITLLHTNIKSVKDQMYTVSLSVWVYVSHYLLA